jgi:putative hydrolase of the HAD superfamily
MPPEHMTRQIDTVLFDLDDTLIDWRKQTRPWPEINSPKVAQVYDFLLAAGHKPTLTSAGFVAAFIEHSESTWRRAPENGWRSPHFETVLGNTIRKSGLDPKDVDMIAAMKAYEWHILPDVVLFPDTLPVLRALREQGYRLGLVTNAYFPIWMREVELEAFGIDEFFDAAITSGDTGWLKPHPAIFWRIMGLLQTTPDRCVFVGDSPRHDIQGANETGLVSVLHAPPGLQREHHGIEADYEIGGLRELLPILEELD